LLREVGRRAKYHPGLKNLLRCDSLSPSL
jgi:hypothetical protein